MQKKKRIIQCAWYNDIKCVLKREYSYFVLHFIIKWLMPKCQINKNTSMLNSVCAKSNDCFGL